jgi:plasmid maintenance system antidote protein VapI
MENIINIKNINKLKEDDKNNKIENLIEYHKKTVNDIINNLNKLTLDAFFEIENKIEEDVFF